jgi:hypothetical protein
LQQTHISFVVPGDADGYTGELTTNQLHAVVTYVLSHSCPHTLTEQVLPENGIFVIEVVESVISAGSIQVMPSELLPILIIVPLRLIGSFILRTIF